jgi:hypothetical protein
LKPKEKGDEDERYMETPSFAKGEDEPDDLKSKIDNHNGRPTVKAPVEEQDKTELTKERDTPTDNATESLKLTDSKSLELK